METNEPLEYRIARHNGTFVLLIKEHEPGDAPYKIARSFDAADALHTYIELSKERGWPEHFRYDAPSGWTQITLDDIAAIDPHSRKHLLRIRDNAAMRDASR